HATRPALAASGLGQSQKAACRTGARDSCWFCQTPTPRPPGAVAAFFVCRRADAAATVGLVSFGYFLWWPGGTSTEWPKSEPVLPGVGVSRGDGVHIPRRPSRRGG